MRDPMTVDFVFKSVRVASMFFKYTEYICEFVKRMTDLGYLIIPGTADQMADMIKAEIVRWTPVVKASGAKID